MSEATRVRDHLVRALEADLIGPSRLRTRTTAPWKSPMSDLTRLGFGRLEALLGAIERGDIECPPSRARSARSISAT